MTRARSIAGAIAGALSSLAIEEQPGMKQTDPPAICGNCRHWHRRNNYACRYNGRWGGGIDGFENCTFARRQLAHELCVAPIRKR